VALVAVLLHGYTALVKSDGGVSAFGIGLFVWSLVPYALATLIGLRWSGVAGALAALIALVIDVLTYYSVFIAPTSSTAALGLLFAPLVNLLLVLPASLLVAYLLSRHRHSHAA
jgi:hypothetical protein